MTARGPTVAHVVLSLDVGGLERVVLDLAREGRALGQGVSIACVERPGALADEARAMGVAVACAGKRPGLRPATVGRLRSIIRDLGPEVVHTHQVGALAYAGPAARLAGGIPVLHTEHGKHYGSRARTRLLGRLAAGFASRFACVSADIAGEVVRRGVAPRRKVVVVPNGIDVGRFADAGGRAEGRAALGIPADAPVVGTVGRLSEVKRQDRLIRAFASVAGEVPGARLLIVGDGPLMGELTGLARSLGVGDRVHLAGYQARPEAFLAMMDVFALTSRSEGMPLSVLEAWAAGLPVVASRVGGLPEMVVEGESGLLFDPEDEPALAAHLLGLLRDPGRRRRLGAAGREVVGREYSLRAMAEAYHRHYVELISGPAGLGIGER